MWNYLHALINWKGTEEEISLSDGSNGRLSTAAHLWTEVPVRSSKPLSSFLTSIMALSVQLVIWFLSCLYIFS